MQDQFRGFSFSWGPRRSSLWIARDRAASIAQQRTTRAPVTVRPPPSVTEGLQGFAGAPAENVTGMDDSQYGTVIFPLIFWSKVLKSYLVRKMNVEWDWWCWIGIGEISFDCLLRLVYCLHPYITHFWHFILKITGNGTGNYCNKMKTIYLDTCGFFSTIKDWPNNLHIIIKFRHKDVIQTTGFPIEHILPPLQKPWIQLRHHSPQKKSQQQPTRHWKVLTDTSRKCIDNEEFRFIV